MSGEKVYLVVENGMEYTDVKRVYLDRETAEAFVDAYNATGGYYEVEETLLGAPDVEYDAPIWTATWTTRRKLKGERRLIMVRDGFTVVVPSASSGGGSYRYFEYFAGPTWRDLMEPPEYEEPAVWIDTFHPTRQEWWTGVTVPDAEVVTRDRPWQPQWVYCPDCEPEKDTRHGSEGANK